MKANTRRNRKRERVYAHVLNEMPTIGCIRNSRDMIDSWNELNHDSINPNSFGQILRGLMASGHISRHQEWIKGREVYCPVENRRLPMRGSWETVYTRLK